VNENDLLPEDEPVPETLDDLLRREPCWHDVRSGLGRLLFGYLFWIVASFFCGALMGIGIAGIAGHGADSKPPLGYLWSFYLGMGLLGLVWPIGYGFVLTGIWRCLVNVPERRWAKWFLFACMTCLLMGPALNFIAGTGGVKQAPDIKRGPVGFKQAKFTRLGAGMMVAGGVIGGTSFVLFMLFLRAIAACFESRVRVWLVNLYLLFVGGLVAASYHVATHDPKVLLEKPSVLLGLAGGWAVAFFGYLGLIQTVRTCIYWGMKSLRSPLAADPDEVPPGVDVEQGMVV
jgi:hypothetical protein